jgi:large subunit ribosomal protein L17
MRHRKHSNQLNVKKEHREAMMASLASAIIEHGRITTTLKKAKALRPFIEKLITRAKSGTLHDRRLVIAKLKGDVDATAKLFKEHAPTFAKRPGGYTRIYKLAPQRIGDAAEMALIEFVAADDTGYRKRRKAAQPKAESAAEAPASEATAPAAAPAP